MKTRCCRGFAIALLCAQFHVPLAAQVTPTWAQVSSMGPTSRNQHAMAYDSQRGRIVLFGGNIGGPSLSDTWEWDGLRWSQGTTGPSSRAGHAMAYDSQRARVVMFGGEAMGIYRNDTWERDGNYTSTAATFGSGCGLALVPIANARPTINTTAQVSLTNIPSSIAFVALGWSRTALGPFPLPLTLAGYGMPGCDLLQSAEGGAQPVTFTGTGTATYGLLLPNWSGLIGVHLFLQGWAFAPGANAGSAIVSNGLEWGIGNS